MGIDDVGESIAKKMTLQSYNTAEQHTSIPATQQKTKATFYLTKEAEDKLNEMCARRMRASGRADKSAMICRAIELLYEEEN